jgi:hypothetical protein
MKKWDPMVLIKAAEAAGVKFDVDDTWLDVNPYGASFNPVGVVWHHTATGTFTKGDMPSLSWCRFPGEYSMKARACHIVVARSGHMQIIAGNGAYHAGAGGPMTVNGKLLPKDEGNSSLIGIEIEASSSTKINKKDRITPKSGINPAQWEATAKFNAALFDILKWPTSSAIRHRDWAPNRKIDIGIDLALVHEEIDKYRTDTPVAPKPKPNKPTVSLINVRMNLKNDHIRLVQEALKKEFPHATLPTNGFFNNSTKIVYKRWQEKCGFTGDDADGLPGRDSLSKLGKKYGFTVK